MVWPNDVLYHHVLSLQLLNDGGVSRKHKHIHLSTAAPPSTEHVLSQVFLYSINSSSFLRQHTSFPFSDPFLSPDRSDLPSDPWAHPSLLRRSVGHIDGSESILLLGLEGYIREACQEKGGAGRKRRWWVKGSNGEEGQDELWEVDKESLNMSWKEEKKGFEWWQGQKVW